jgi:hypothetical protein
VFDLVYLFINSVCAWAVLRDSVSRLLIKPLNGDT